MSEQKEWLTRNVVKAKALEDDGVERIDFVRAWYYDETTVLSSKAFDKDGNILPAVDLDLPLTGVYGELSQGFYSYSPAKHFVMKVGKLEWPESPVDAPLPPVAVPSEHYKELIAILTWQPNLPTDTMLIYAKHESSEVRKAVATNPNTPPEVMSVLATDKDSKVRGELARNPALSQEHFHVLLEDKDSGVRSSLARHPNIVLDALYKLARQPDSSVAAVALSNPRFPYELLLGLRGAPDIGNRLNEVNFNLCLANLNLLERLFESKDENIRRMAQKNRDATLAEFVELVGDNDIVTLFNQTQSFKAVRQRLIDEHSQLETFTFASQKDINAAIARHPDATKNILDEVSKYDDKWVRTVVAENENTLLSTLSRLIQDKEMAVHARAGARLAESDFVNRSDEVRELFVAYKKFPEMHVEGLRKLAENRNLSEDIYLSFPIGDDLVELGLVQNSSLPHELLISFTHNDKEVNGYKLSDLARQRLSGLEPSG